MDCYVTENPHPISISSQKRDRLIAHYPIKIPPRYFGSTFRWGLVPTGGNLLGLISSSPIKPNWLCTCT